MVRATNRVKSPPSWGRMIAGFFIGVVIGITIVVVAIALLHVGAFPGVHVSTPTPVVSP